MTAWPGEKLGLDDVVVVAGDLDYRTVQQALQVGDATGATVTLTAGDELILYSTWARTLKADDVVGACTWLLESTGGAVEVSTSRDPHWSHAAGLDWAPAAAELKAGRTLVPLPVADRTFEWLHGDAGGLVIRLRVTSGTVTLSSVWLQVEPPGGLLTRTGWQWSDFLTPGPVLMPGDVSAGSYGAGLSVTGETDRHAALDRIRDGDANTPPPTAPDDAPSIAYRVTDRGSGYSMNGTTFTQDRAVSFAPPFALTDVWLQVGYSFAFWTERPDHRELPDVMQGLIAGRDYEKLDAGSSWASYGEFADADTVAVEWAPVQAHVSYEPSPGRTDSFGATIAASFATRLLQSTGGAWVGAGWPPPMPQRGVHVKPIESGTSVELGTPPAGYDFTVSIRGDLFEPGVYPAGGEPGDTGFHQWNVTPSTTIRYQMPDFRYRVPIFTRDPDAVARTPRFYVTFTEVEDDPKDVSHVVGIGKPADDKSVFRVPTPLGTLRELRPGEKVSDVSVCYPLKVKLEDGSWTVVAGMTPDE